MDSEYNSWCYAHTIACLKYFRGISSDQKNDREEKNDKTALKYSILDKCSRLC